MTFLADAVRPPVTVIDQNPAELGRQAIERIILRMENPNRFATGGGMFSESTLSNASPCSPGRDHSVRR